MSLIKHQTTVQTFRHHTGRAPIIEIKETSTLRIIHQLHQYPGLCLSHTHHLATFDVVMVVELLARLFLKFENTLSLGCTFLWRAVRAQIHSI